MTALAPVPTVEVEELTVEQSHELFDREARRLVGMSREEFLDGYDAGRIVEDQARPGVTELLFLLPYGRAC